MIPQPREMPWKYGVAATRSWIVGTPGGEPAAGTDRLPVAGEIIYGGGVLRRPAIGQVIAVR